MTRPSATDRRLEVLTDRIEDRLMDAPLGLHQVGELAGRGPYLTEERPAGGGDPGGAVRRGGARRGPSGPKPHQGGATHLGINVRCSSEAATSNMDDDATFYPVGSAREPRFVVRYRLY